MVKEAAESKQFQMAEKFREQILKIDSMALTEIVGAAEIIESEKAKSIDLNHKELWSALYEKLNDAEASDLYFSLKNSIFRILYG